MTAVLDVEAADFLDASRSMTRDVGDPLAHAVTRVQGALGDCAAMAGADPGGTAWAAAYDKAAVQALDAAEGVVNATYRVGAMFEQTARNYAAADAASGGHPVHVPHVGMFAQTSIGVEARPPSAHGGAGSTPHGWTLVEGVVGRVWPDGHQGRLLSAASAWEAAASTLADRADWTMLAGIPFGRDRLPEADDMGTVCRSVAGHVREVASVFRQMARSCRDLAHHLDVVHSEVEHELISLAAQTAAIETAGAALSVITLGAAEAPTQLVEATRIAAIGARIRELIESFTLLARAATLRVVDAAERALAVTARARALRAARLISPTLAIARTMPRARYVRVALGRLGVRSQTLPGLVVDARQIEKKFKHAVDFGVLSGRGRSGFAAFDTAVRRFVRRPSVRQMVSRYRNEEVIINLDARTGLMVMQKPDGQFITGYALEPDQIALLIRTGKLGGG